jgi:hypothetical protein
MSLTKSTSNQEERNRHLGHVLGTKTSLVPGDLLINNVQR